ncbi:MAG: hypothetical protein H7Y17_08950 [Chlorobia bacterium]|nr:hypothetical protein [Fimbriimonadaceae bacterium]
MKKAWQWLKESGPGRWLDLFIFALNLFLLPMLAGWFNHIIQRASAGDEAAARWLFSIGIALLVLAPAGATLKRWHAHQRKNDGLSDPMGSCLFNPIFYLCLMFVVYAAVQAYIFQEVYGRREPTAEVFMGSLCGGITVCIIHTWLVYRYFSKPKEPPRSAFLRGPVSSRLGDGLIWANALLFQMFWNLFVDIGFPRVGSVGEALARVPLLAFMALLLYFPPRIFYLAQDRKTSAWLWMLFANLPTILRFVIGVGK